MQTNVYFANCQSFGYDDTESCAEEYSEYDQMYNLYQEDMLNMQEIDNIEEDQKKTQYVTKTRDQNTNNLAIDFESININE